jgi:hypothetical protein
MLKVATILLVIMLVFAGLYALLVTFIPQFIAGSTMEARAGKAMGAITDADCADAFVIQTRHLGVMAVAVTIAMFFIVFAAFRKGQPWAWWCCLIAGLIVWGYGVYIQASEADIMNLVLHLVGTVLLLLGVFLPIRSFFAKKG